MSELIQPLNDDVSPVRQVEAQSRGNQLVYFGGLAAVMVAIAAVVTSVLPGAAKGAADGQSQHVRRGGDRGSG